MLRGICAIETQTLVNSWLQLEVRTGLAKIIHLVWEPYPFGGKNILVLVRLSEPFSKLWTKSLCCNGWVNFSHSENHLPSMKSCFEPFYSFFVQIGTNTLSDEWASLQSDLAFPCRNLFQWMFYVGLLWLTYTCVVCLSNCEHCRIPHLSESNCEEYSLQKYCQLNS